MDFSLILFVALVITGTLWLADHLWLVPARQRSAEALRREGRAEEAERRAREPVLVEYARAFFPVILIVFLIRSFIVEPFRIPSGSMLPSLRIGDFILVNKYHYGIRLPVANVKIVELGEPERGDVAVFRFPLDPSVNYIKRVVGLPGDHVQYQGKKLYVNGEPMAQGDARPTFDFLSGEWGGVVAKVREQLGSRDHDILVTDRPEMGMVDIVVPEGKYFVMGDNRDFSNDSRYWGYVPEANLVGRAFFIWFSWNGVGEPLWRKIQWDRIGDTVR